MLFFAEFVSGGIENDEAYSGFFKIKVKSRAIILPRGFPS